jgi:hypothetical protein
MFPSFYLLIRFCRISPLCFFLLFFLFFLHFCFNSSLSNLSVSFSLSSSLYFSLSIVISHVAIFTYFLLNFSLKIYSSSLLCYFSLYNLFLFISCLLSLSIFLSLSSYYLFLSLFSAFLPKIIFNLLKRKVFRGLYLYLLWFCMFSLSALRKQPLYPHMCWESAKDNFIVARR